MMHPHSIRTMFMLRCFLTGLLLLTTSMVSANPQITLPVRFHIVQGLDMQKGSLTMSSWVTETDIQNLILPEINRIWRPANIQYSIDSVLLEDSLHPKKRQKKIDYIVNAQRTNGKSDPKRIKKLNKLVDQSQHQPNMVNVYLVPYLGETSQGNAKRKTQRVYVGQWSDKSSRAKRPPEKVLLVESRPFKKGSLARTIAHEIGHVLGLKHPDKKKQTTFGLLMGGKNPGYILTTEDINTAYRAAEALK